MKLNKTIYAVAIISMAVALIGCPGQRGPTGPAGVSSFASSRIVSSYNCSGTISGLSGGAAALNGLDVDYTAVLTGSGDVYASGAIIDNVDQTSGTVFYSAGQVGALTAGVVITADYAGLTNGGFWNISVDRNTLITSIEYVDSSLGIESPVDLVFTPSACTVQNW